MNSSTFARFEKQIILKKVGLVGQKKIFASSVLIVGMGGLGCPLLYYLSALSLGEHVDYGGDYAILAIVVYLCVHPC